MSDAAAVRVNPGWLLEAMTRRFAEAGVVGGDALKMASALIETSLMGIDSHGIRLFPTYLRELEEGRAKRDPSFVVDRPAPALARLDGDGGPGILVGLAAAALAGDIAEMQGLGLVLAANSNHFGAASIYALHLAERGKLALIMTSAAARVGPAAGGPPTLGTNPICFAAPCQGGSPYLFDMATSQMAYCQVKAALASGAPLPAGWAVDRDGIDCAASGAAPFALQPLGGYKGQGLGLMVSMLTAMLAAAPADWAMSHLDGTDFATPRGVAHFVLAIDPVLVGGAEALASMVAAHLAAYRAAAGPSAQLASDREWATRERRSRDGIPVDPAERAALERCLGPMSTKAPAGG